MSAIDIAYHGTVTHDMCSTDVRYHGTFTYAMSGTGIVYRGTVTHAMTGTDRGVRWYLNRGEENVPAYPSR